MILTPILMVAGPKNVFFAPDPGDDPQQYIYSANISLLITQPFIYLMKQKTIIISLINGFNDLINKISFVLQNLRNPMICIMW